MNAVSSKRKVAEQGKPGMPPEQRAEILEKLGVAIAAKRKEAIEGRQNCGIEKQWEEDECHYQGYDDANKHEFVDVKSKPTEGGRSTDQLPVTGSTLFPNITQPYVDAAAAKVQDMLLPTDDRNFVVEPTPLPDVLDEEEGWPPLLAPEQIQPPGAAGLMAAQAGMPAAAQPANPAAAIMGDPAAAAGMPGQPQPAPQMPVEQPEQDILGQALAKLKAIRDKANDAAEHAQETIDDALVECSYQTELRRMIDDASRIGTGVMKGPVAVKRKIKVWAKNPTTGERELVIKQETKPASKRVDPWNAFPDPACGEDIHAGGYFFERDFLTPKKLQELKGGTGPAAYLDEQIDKVLAEGPQRGGQVAPRGFQQETEQAGTKPFEVWYFYGTLTGKDLEAAGCTCEDETKQYNVVVTMVNTCVIKANLNPLTSGEFPFDFLAWKVRPNMPWGTGVARHGRVAQRIVTAATRNLMDNAGASAKPHKVMADGIEQEGDPWTWRAQSESLLDMSKSMVFFIQPSLQAELMAIIQMGERMMEVHTGLPMIILGMQGNVQETAAGRALQNNNGSTVLRRVARNFDAMTERHIRRYHTWLMLYSEDDQLKGDFQIKARGSSALVERDLQNQQIPTMLSLSLNPAYELDPALSAEEYLKSQHFDPKAFKLSDKKKAELAQNQQPPVLPQVEAAKVREEGATRRLEMQLQHDSQESEMERQLKKLAIEVDGQLGAANLSMEERVALNEAKVTLAGLSMKIKTQRDLSAIKGGQFLAPPTEPAGRAQNGMAFTQ